MRRYLRLLAGPFKDGGRRTLAGRQPSGATNV